MADITPEAERVLVALLRPASVARKVKMMASANRASRELALCGLRMLSRRSSPRGCDAAWRAFGWEMSWPKKLTARFLPMKTEEIELFAALRTVVTAFEQYKVSYYAVGPKSSVFPRRRGQAKS